MSRRTNSHAQPSNLDDRPAPRGFRTAVIYGSCSTAAITARCSCSTSVCRAFSIMVRWQPAPLTAPLFGVNVLSGRWTPQAGSRSPMTVGACVNVAGRTLLVLLSNQSPYWLMLPAFVMIPAGLGLGGPAMTSTVLAAVDRGLSGLASGLLNAPRQPGGAIGAALFRALTAAGLSRIVTGLHPCAIVAVMLLIGAASLACICVDPSGRWQARPRPGTSRAP